MIRDAYLNKDISNFGGEKNFLINAHYSGKKIQKSETEEEITEENFYSYTLKGYYQIDKELFMEDSYPYQALLFKVIKKEEFNEGYIVDRQKKGFSTIITKVENGIPIKSTFISADEKEELEEKIERYFLSEGEESNILEINEKDYYPSFATPFYPESELQAVLRKKKLSTLALPAAIGFFIYTLAVSIPPYISQNILSQKFEKLSKEKTKLQTLISSFSTQGMPLSIYQKEEEQTKNLIITLKKIKKFFPNANIKKVLQSKNQISVEIKTRDKE